MCCCQSIVILDHIDIFAHFCWRNGRVIRCNDWWMVVKTFLYSELENKQWPGQICSKKKYKSKYYSLWTFGYIPFLRFSGIVVVISSDWLGKTTTTNEWFIHKNPNSALWSCTLANSSDISTEIFFKDMLILQPGLLHVTFNLLINEPRHVVSYNVAF